MYHALDYDSKVDKSNSGVGKNLRSQRVLNLDREGQVADENGEGGGNFFSEPEGLVEDSEAQSTPRYRESSSLFYDSLWSSEITLSLSVSPDKSVDKTPAFSPTAEVSQECCLALNEWLPVISDASYSWEDSPFESGTGGLGSGGGSKLERELGRSYLKAYRDVNMDPSDAVGGYFRGDPVNPEKEIDS